ncbi:MAG: hypothetical protein K6C40_10465, partial [Thermoguttaceae bacterium]|nr:hypothetical protein [Thermoguttaceae bacterium]
MISEVLCEGWRISREDAELLAYVWDGMVLPSVRDMESSSTKDETYLKVPKDVLTKYMEANLRRNLTKPLKYKNETTKK